MTFDEWYKTSGVPGKMISQRAAWNAATEDIKQNFTICEKEPSRFEEQRIADEFVEIPLYREAQL